MFNFDSGGPLGIHFANGARAFGADYSSSIARYAPLFSATVSLDNGEVFQFTALPKPSSQFFGFISPTPIRSMVFSDPGIAVGNLHEELIGNLYMVVLVPEPGSAALLALGAAALLWRSKKVRRV